MTVTLVPEMSAAPVPEWFYPPEGREWTVDDLDNLPPDAPRRLEIIDGALIVMAPQQAFHTRSNNRIENGLEAQAPAHLMVMREWTVALPNGDAPEPDIVVFDRKGYYGRHQTRVDADHVVLAVEVISPDSRKRDIQRKPQLYAEAGIDRYWIVDDSNGTTIIRTYRRDGSGTYQLTGEHRDQLVCTEPFAIELDLSTKALGL